LDAEDSAVLRWWIAATSERPVVVLLDAANRTIAAYGPPTRLEGIVEAARSAPATGDISFSGCRPASNASSDEGAVTPHRLSEAGPAEAHPPASAVSPPPPN